MVFLIAMVFWRKISVPEKSMKRCTLGWGKAKPWDSRKINTFFTLNCNISRFLKYEKWFFFCYENRDLKNCHHKNIYFKNCSLPFTATLNRKNSGKNFSNYDRRWIGKFFPILLRGVTYILPLTKLGKKTEKYEHS